MFRAEDSVEKQLSPSYSHVQRVFSLKFPNGSTPLWSPFPARVGFRSQRLKLKYLRMGPTCSPRLNFPRDKFPLSSKPSGPTDPSSPSSYVQNPSEALVASARPFPEPNENQFYQSNSPKRETSQTEAKRVATRVGITSQTSHTSCYQSGHLTRIKQNRIVSLASKQKQESPRPVLLLFDTFPSFVIALLLPLSLSLSLSLPAPQPSIVPEPRTLAPGIT